MKVVTLRQFLQIAVAFTIGALACEVHALRTEMDLRAQAECAYHTGVDEGYRDAKNEPVSGRLAVKVHDNADGSQEIVPYIEGR